MNRIKSAPADAGTKDSVTTSRRRARPGVIVIAAAAGVLVWVAAVPLAGTSLEVSMVPGGRENEVGLAMVAIVAILAGLAAWCALVLAQRALRRGMRAWRIAGSAFLALSLLGPLTAAATSSTLIALLTMHAVVGLTLLIFLPRTSAGRRQKR